MDSVKKILLIFSISLSLFANVFAVLPGLEAESEGTSTHQPRKRIRKNDGGSDGRKSKKTLGTASSAREKPQQKTPTSFPQGVGLYKTFRTILSQGSEPIVDISLDPITPEKEEKEGSRRFVPSFVHEEDSTPPKEWHKEAEQRVLSFRKYAVGRRFIDYATNVALGRISFFSKKGEPVDFPKEFKHVFLSGWPSNGVIEEEKDPVKGMETLVKKLKEGAVKIKEDDEEKEVFQDYGIRFITKDYPQGELAEPRSRHYNPFFEGIQKIMTEEAQGGEPLLGQERRGVHAKLTKKASDWSIQAKLYFHTEQAIRLSIQESIDKYKKSKMLVGNHYAIIDICSWFDMCWCCGDTLASQAHLEKKFGLKVYFRFSGMNRYPDFPFNEKKTVRLGDERQKFQTYSDPDGHRVYETQKQPYRPYVAHMVTEDLKAATAPDDQGASV